MTGYTINMIPDWKQGISNRWKSGNRNFTHCQWSVWNYFL